MQPNEHYQKQEQNSTWELPPKQNSWTLPIHHKLLSIYTQIRPHLGLCRLMTPSLRWTFTVMYDHTFSVNLQITHQMSDHIILKWAVILVIAYYNFNFPQFFEDMYGLTYSLYCSPDLTRKSHIKLLLKQICIYCPFLLWMTLLSIFMEALKIVLYLCCIDIWLM